MICLKYFRNELSSLVTVFKCLDMRIYILSMANWSFSVKFLLFNSDADGVDDRQLDQGEGLAAGELGGGGQDLTGNDRQYLA